MLRCGLVLRTPHASLGQVLGLDAGLQGCQLLQQVRFSSLQVQLRLQGLASMASMSSCLLYRVSRLMLHLMAVWGLG